MDVLSWQCASFVDDGDMMCICDVSEWWFIKVGVLLVLQFI
jgi:hypothetical protein